MTSATNARFPADKEKGKVFKMRKFRILSLIFVAVFALLSCASCSKAVTAHVFLTVIETKIMPDGTEKETLIAGPMWADIKGTEANPPTVLQATREILEANGIKYTYDETTESITAIKNKKEGTAKGVVTGWIFELNGEEPNTRAKDTEIFDDDGIVYYLKSWVNEDVEGSGEDEGGSETVADTEAGADEAGD